MSETALVVIAIIGAAASTIVAVIAGIFARSASIRAAQAAAALQAAKELHEKELADTEARHTAELQAARQPAEDSGALIQVTREYMALFQSHLVLNQQVVAQAAISVAQSAEQTHNAGLKDGTINTLTLALAEANRKVDGMPVRIEELVARALVKQGFILKQEEFIDEQHKALNETGGKVESERPVEPAELQLTPLTPPSLLADIRAEKESEEKQKSGQGYTGEGETGG
jgi:hypothetical protein